MNDDFNFEPVRGLPAELPKGERLLWQGAPDWRVLARQAFHVRAIAVYFALLLAWSIERSLAAGFNLFETARETLVLDGFAILALAILYGLAWLIGRSTVYTITSARIILRYGLALPMTINLPFSCITSAALKRNANGTGDLPLALKNDTQVAYLLLWPHVRPWLLSKTEPMLRAVPDAEKVAQILAEALAGGPVTLAATKLSNDNGRRRFDVRSLAGGEA